MRSKYNPDAHKRIDTKTNPFCCPLCGKQMVHNGNHRKEYPKEGDDYAGACTVVSFSCEYCPDVIEVIVELATPDEPDIKTVGELYSRLFNRDLHVPRANTIKDNQLKALELTTGCGKQCEQLIFAVRDFLALTGGDEATKYQMLNCLDIQLGIAFFG